MYSNNFKIIIYGNSLPKKVIRWSQTAQCGTDPYSQCGAHSCSSRSSPCPCSVRRVWSVSAAGRCPACAAGWWCWWDGWEPPSWPAGCCRSSPGASGLQDALGSRRGMRREWSSGATLEEAPGPLLCRTAAHRWSWRKRKAKTQSQMQTLTPHADKQFQAKELMNILIHQLH